ncbi:DUF1624 domain-containing protein [Candidatus Woesearchaeota archaeon]|nr:DUF1624 domain-containing protein [Candidatus Woesearchaeota archaeon]
MNNFVENRFWEIDLLRAIAIIMMIIFHLLFDLNYFGIYRLNVDSGFWLYFARATATLFIFLVGISLTLSFSKAKKSNNTKGLFTKYFKRGLMVFSWGLAITLITSLFLEEGAIIFGILHFIGISIILAYPFLRLRHLNLVFGVIIFSFGLYLKKFAFSFPWLMWLGLRPEKFYTLDYFPLLPWFGLVLIGIFFGNLFYADYQRKLKLREPSNSFLRYFCFLGRNALLIYLIHQPLLIITLYLVGG